MAQDRMTLEEILQKCKDLDLNTRNLILMRLIEHVKAKGYLDSDEHYAHSCMLNSFAQIIPEDTDVLFEFLEHVVFKIAEEHKDRALGTILFTLRNMQQSK
jgi:hypothetical protein